MTRPNRNLALREAAFAMKALLARAIPIAEMEKRNGGHIVSALHVDGGQSTGH